MRSHLLSPRVIYSVAFYLLTVALICVARPSVAFRPDGRIKQFGVGEGSSIFSLGVLCSAVAVLCFYAFCMVDVLCK